MNLADKAARIAVEAHLSINQVRKYTGEPYFNHCKNVAYLTSLVSEDEEQIAAAYLHDVLEDVLPKNPKYDRNLILNEFGDNVLKYVIELTEPVIAGNRKERKLLECERLSLISDKSQTIKYADLIDNSRTILKYDPGFSKIYIEEKMNILFALKKGNQYLRGIAIDICVDRYFCKEP